MQGKTGSAMPLSNALVESSKCRKFGRFNNIPAKLILLKDSCGVELRKNKVVMFTLIKPKGIFREVLVT